MGRANLGGYLENKFEADLEGVLRTSLEIKKLIFKKMKSKSNFCFYFLKIKTNPHELFQNWKCSFFLKPKNHTNTERELPIFYC